MKIAGRVIQNRFIETNTEHLFIAKYKGKLLEISTNHGFGRPDNNWLSRFNIDVTDMKSGMADVDTVEDLHTMRDAIRRALEGAKL